MATIGHHDVARSSGCAQGRLDGLHPSGEEADGDGLLMLLEGMSLESRQLRFFTAGPDLTEAARWAADAGSRNGLGLVATTGDPPHIVAHAAYEAIDADRAEIAFEVADRCAAAASARS